MTIQFVPGDPNNSAGCISQASWRNHHIVAYGSGNNVIIYTLTNFQKKNLQTIYLEHDPYSVAVNGTNGLIAITVGECVSIFKPLHEFMKNPKWELATDIQVDSSLVKCLDWALDEGELVIGTKSSLSLYHIFDDLGNWRLERRWLSKQPSAVESVAITPDASKIISYNSLNLDSFAKLWLRGNYSDTCTLFELKYLQHDSQVWLTDFFWRSPATSKTSLVDLLLMTTMKKTLQSLGPDTSHDVLYTVTSDKKLNIWATYDVSGHCHIKLWSLLDLTEKIDSKYLGCLILDGEKLKQTLPELLEKEQNFQSNLYSHLSKLQDFSSQDLLLVWGFGGEMAIYLITNITMSPPTAMKFIHLSTVFINKICLPSSIKQKDPDDPQALRLASRPVAISSLTKDENSCFQFLLHDCIKHTIRLNRISVKDLLTESENCIQLRNKFQGHKKSIKKLVTSTSTPEGNILLSISDFAQHNYIWEPLLLQPDEHKYMSITRRFRLDVSRVGDENDHNQGIVDALLINDVTKPSGHLRHHIAVVIEKGGFMSVWDCNGVTMDDREAELMKRSDLIDCHGNRILKAPQAFYFFPIKPSVFGVLCVFDAILIKAWRLSVSSNKVVCQTTDVESLPGSYSGFTMVSAVDTFLEKDLSVIDDTGLFRSLSCFYEEREDKFKWEELLRINTNVVKSNNIHGASLINKLALVDEDGLRLTIWDLRSGLLEYEEKFPESYGKVRDLDWAFIDSSGSSTSALLSVGFSRFVQLYTQLRYDYTNKIPTFAVLKQIDISDYTSHEIADLIWIDDGYLVVGCGNQFFIDDKWVDVGEKSSSSASTSINSTVKQLMSGYDSKRTHFMTSDLARILNGPLPVYHPQFIIQALLNNEVKLVKDIMIALLGVLRRGVMITWNLNLNFLDAILPAKKAIERRLSHPDSETNGSSDIFDEFNETNLQLLIEKLLKVSLPLLTRHQQITLTHVVGLVNELSTLENSLDENGLKFLLGFKLFQNSLKQTQLTMRDINWALHSDQKEMLFSSLDNHYKHRMNWDSVKQCGLVYWTDTARLKNVVEMVARNEFGDSRDPAGRVSVLFLAINKKQVLVGLWRTVSHPEKEKVLKFMSNDFTQQRWKTAASKNAFVLLGKHRFMDAAYFFLLAGLVKDCCITLCNKVGDVELALAVARVNNDDTALMHMIENFILPKAIKEGDRWTTSWVFWKMKTKEIAIQALVKSPYDVVEDNREKFSPLFQKKLSNLRLDVKSKSFLQDDPVLAILFQKLRFSKLNYLQGSKSITPQEEFDFVIKVCTIYSRMGCDYLALLLLRNWRFLDMTTEKRDSEQFMKVNGELFREFSAAPMEGKSDTNPAAFEEPDMSAFDFGF